MIPGLGKAILTIGSAPTCDIRLGGPGVAPEHARLARQPDGSLMFIDLGVGPSAANGAPLAAGAQVPFDFRVQFVVGQAAVPNVHPAIAMMLMAPGQLPITPGQLVFGRDPNQSNVVVQNASVSSRHVVISFEPLTATDLGSSGGTWLGAQRFPAQQPVPIEPHAILAVGPVPLPMQMIPQLAQALGAAAAPPGPLASPASAGAAASGEGAAPVRRKHQTVIGQIAMKPGAQPTRSIGRTPENDIVLAHPQVSSKHAILHTIQGQIFVEDRGSSNGTWVRGQRIPAGQRVPVVNGEKVFIGPMPLLIQVEAQEVAVVVEDHQAEWSGRPLYEIEAWDLVIQVPDRDNPRELRMLLDHVSFKAMPGDLIALMGPSGAGKTTLLLTLNGYLPPSGGQVRINGEDLYAIYDAMRGSIGYVPQDDIVHPELTVWEAVRYSARFRLPPDFSSDEIDRRVDETLKALGLESVAHLQIGKPERKILSGGQRKRVNIAMELVTDPIIMFLDEPTSGLAADDTQALVQLLADLAKRTGKTIITTIHQPAKDEYEKFNLALILGQGGVPVFYGPTRDGYRFFGSFLERQGKPNTIDNPRDMFDMLNQRERPIWEAMRAQNPATSRFEARRAAAREWQTEFFNPQNPIFQRMFSGPRSVGTGAHHQGVPRTRPRTSGQFFLLLSRYARIKVRDSGGLLIMLLQAPIIGLLLALVFGGQKQAIPYWCLGALQELSRRYGDEIGSSSRDFLANMTATADNAGALFFLVVAAVWFGTSNAAREIVSERAIYKRERMVNLKVFNYVFSKFVLLSLFSALQCAVLLGIVFFALGFNGGLEAFGQQLALLTITAMDSVALGLLLSSMVTSSEAATSLTPIALLPQVVLGGLMVPMTTNSILEYPMYLVPARWGFEGVVALERAAVRQDPAWVVDLSKPDLNSADNYIEGGRFFCAEAQIASDSFNGAWGFVNWDLVWLPYAVLGGMMLLSLVWMLIILKRRDSI
ncbi:MAG: FHA domain-containing protein [Polyangiaceae bacterium]|nr:FHA domain-containing protein [Polyangiaceae bacterium]